MGDLGESYDEIADKEWEIIARVKRVAQFNQIPLKWRIAPVDLASQFSADIDLRKHIEKAKILTEVELRITNITSIATLWKLINREEFSSEQVITAFCKRAAVAHQLTNCLTEIFFKEAIECAKELDQGPSRGAWHGIPVSLKDQFDVKGQDSTIGYVARVNYPATRNSEIVDSILQQGGIFYCKTTVPQTVMTADTVSNLFGRTLNPVNKNIIPSGSSGGEAALLACHGSIIGIGTDTGGSIRNPAAACELYGLKPSSGRVSFKDVVSSNDGNPLVITVAGPMATSLESLEYFMKHTLSREPWKNDPEVLPIRWTKQVCVPERLRIGIMLDHGDPKPPHKSFYRIIDELSQRLRAAGVTIVRWESDELSRLHKALAAVLGMTCLMDGGADIARQVDASGEPLILPGFVDDKFLLTITDMWKLNVTIRKLRARYWELWQEAKLDAVISPTNTFAFLTKEEYLNKPPEIGYSSIFNVLDYSVVNIPTGKLIKDDLSPEHIALGLEGFKVGCQVACGRLEEEKVLAISKICNDLASIS